MLRVRVAVEGNKGVEVRRRREGEEEVRGRWRARYN